MQSQDTRKGFAHSGLLARHLAGAGITVNFIGVQVLAIAMFFGSFMFGGFWPGGSGFDSLVIAGISYVFSPAIKIFAGVVFPAIARAQVFAGRVGYSGYQPAPPKARRQFGAGLLIVSGALTIPPIIFGGPMVLEHILEMFGVLPFVPHFVGGALLIAAGILAFLWVPSSMSVSQPAFISVTGQPAFVARPQPEVREVILVVCPFCGTKNPQGVARCSNCKGKL